MLSVACVNPDCKRTTVTFTVAPAELYSNGQFSRILDGESLFFRRILPEGFSKPLPEFIPLALREDYAEACLIRDLSPKASATLVRRCLQGMIRNFCGISKARLIDEIDALRKAVNNGSADRSITPDSVEAIDRVRGIGNIGAHMERDIDLIVPVDQDEAQTLIELVELLFEEWYIARNKRQARLARIGSIADAKQALKSENMLTAPTLAIEGPVT